LASITYFGNADQRMRVQRSTADSQWNGKGKQIAAAVYHHQG
jgi:hypothetical protein